MCQHPAHQANVSTKRVLCTPDSIKFLRHPVDSSSSLKSSANLKKLQRWYSQERDKTFMEIIPQGV